MAVMDPYFGQIAAQEAITKAGMSFSMIIIVLVIGFVFNLLLVLLKKYTKVRTVFITGQVMVQQSSVALWLIFFCFPSLNNIVVSLILGLLLGTYWAVFSNLTVEPCQELTQGGGFAFGHQQMLGVWITDKISGLFAKCENDAKDIGDIKFPKFLSLFNDNATFVVFAYKQGGLKASMIIPLLSGFIQIACGAFAAYYFGLAHFGGYSGNFDWVTLWPVIGFLMNKLQYVGVVIALIVMLLIPQIQYFKNRKGYFKIVEDYEGYLEDKENNKQNSI